MSELLLTGAVTLVTASALWNFIQFLVVRHDNGKKDLADIKAAIAKLSDKVDENQAILARTHILRFSDECRNGIIHSDDYFRQQLQDIDVYERYCEKHPDFSNGLTVISAQYIKDEYARQLKGGNHE